MSSSPTGHVQPAGTGAELPRVSGFTSVVGILVGTVIGSGIFVAPNRIAELVGSPQLILAVWVVGGLLSFFGALTFADLHPRLLTPPVAILATGAWAAVLSVTGTFEQLATYVVFGQWIFFGLTVAAVMILRAKRPGLPRPYRTWGYPVTPVVFILAALYVSASTLITQPLNAAAGLAIILAGVPACLYWQKHRVSDRA